MPLTLFANGITKVNTITFRVNEFINDYIPQANKGSTVRLMSKEKMKTDKQPRDRPLSVKNKDFGRCCDKIYRDEMMRDRSKSKINIICQERVSQLLILKYNKTKSCERLSADFCKSGENFNFVSSNGTNFDEENFKRRHTCLRVNFAAFIVLKQCD